MKPISDSNLPGRSVNTALPNQTSVTSAALVAIVEEEMSMSIVVVVVDIHAIVVVARDDVEHLACHRLSVKSKRAGCPLGCVVEVSEVGPPGGSERSWSRWCVFSIRRSVRGETCQKGRSHAT